MVQDEGLVYEATAPTEKGKFSEKPYFLTGNHRIHIFE